MKAIELIKELEKLIEAHGNCEMAVWSDDSDDQPIGMIEVKGGVLENPVFLIN